MDNYIISKITDYYSTNKNLQLSKELRNKAICKNLLKKCFKSTCYVAYTTNKSLSLVSLPSKKTINDFPSLDYESMYSKSIKNYAIFYKIEDSQRNIHIFQLLPKKYYEFKPETRSNITETCFYSISDDSFWVVINHEDAYFFKNLELKKSVVLETGFFFEEVLLNNRLHSDFYSQYITVQDLITNDVFKTNLEKETYYDIISKEYIIIDCSVTSSFLDNVLPKDEVELKDKKNSLFKFHLVKGSPNTIKLEFIKYMPEKYRLNRINPEMGYYWSKNEEENNVVIYCKETLINTITIEDMENILAIEAVDTDNILVEYDTYFGLIDIYTGKMFKKIDMATKIPGLKYLGYIEKEGDYYHLLTVIDNVDIGEWKQFVLDLNFNILYTIEKDEYLCFHD